MRRLSCAILSALLVGSCARSPEAPVAKAGPTPPPGSAYPIAVDPARVGKYPMRTKSGGGYFYDEVLEYRVWIDHEDRSDTYEAFATFEAADAFAKKTAKAQEPLALVRQHEHVNEPKPGTFEHKREDRVTEWRVAWLAANKRGPHSIPDFLKKRALIGTWESRAEPRIRVTYAKDGTWKSVLRLGDQDYHGHGTWDVAAGVLRNKTLAQDEIPGVEGLELPYLSEEKLVAVEATEYRYVCPVQQTTNTMRRVQ